MSYHEERAPRENAALRDAMAEAKARRGYLIVHVGTQMTHAAVDTVRGWGGYDHPRTLCQPHSPRSYAGASLNQDAAVECKRCLASMSKRGL